MSGYRRNRSTLELGHDSFLDIVANLVGILIILVVILGSQSRKVIEEIESEQDADSIAMIDPDEIEGQPRATDEMLSELAQHSMRAAAARLDSTRFEHLIKQQDAKLAMVKQQRGLLLDLLAEAQAAWDDKKSQLDKERTLVAARQTQFDKARRELEQLQGERTRLENRAAPVVSLAHLPTPMAKTVFGDEIHLRLKGNLVSVVPVDRLVEEIKQDFERAVSGSREGQLDGAVGPIRGYVARYVMEKSRGLSARGGSAQMMTRVQLVGMTLEPLAEPHGQSIDKVLTGSSELDIELAGRDPGMTTITVWVYPDSFGSFRSLKEQLYRKGFATAARPLPMDRPISGSPQGSRSSAQ